MKAVELIKKAVSRGRRKITSTQRGGCLTWMLKITGISRHPVKINKKISTACWSMVDGKHQIQMSDQLVDHVDSDKVKTDAKMVDYLYKVLRHEAEHGIQTRLLDTIVSDLKKLELPFSLFNLFEDARIEYNSAKRSESKGGEGAFRWVNYEPDMDDETTEATRMFYALKQREAGLKKSSSAYLPKWLGLSEMMYNGRKKQTHLVILDFYRRVINAKQAIDIIPILQEWVEIFGFTASHPNPQPRVMGESDPNHSDDSNIDTDNRVQQDDASKSNTSTTVASNGKGVADWVTSRKHKIPVDYALVDRIQRAMHQLIKKGATNRVDRGLSGTHLDVSKALTGATDVFKRRGEAKGKRSMVLVIDWSGSMKSKWQSQGGKELFLAMRKLHRKGVIDLDVIFTRDAIRTWNGANSVLNKNASEKVDVRIAKSLPNGSAEFVLSSMKANEQLLRKAKSVVIFTDGDLHDSMSDLNQFKSMGVSAIASVVQPTESRVQDARDQMNRFFSRSLVATHATELARLIVKEVLKNA